MRLVLLDSAGVANRSRAPRLAISAEALRRWRLSRPGVSRRSEENIGAPERRNRQTFGSGRGARRPAETMAGRTDLHMAWPMQTTGRESGKSQSKGARISAPRIHQAHARNTVRSRLMFPDRLSTPRLPTTNSRGVQPIEVIQLRRPPTISESIPG